MAQSYLNEDVSPILQKIVTIETLVRADANPQALATHLVYILKKVEFKLQKGGGVNLKDTSLSTLTSKRVCSLVKDILIVRDPLDSIQRLLPSLLSVK